MVSRGCERWRRVAGGERSADGSEDREAEAEGKGGREREKREEEREEEEGAIGGRGIRRKKYLLICCTEGQDKQTNSSVRLTCRLREIEFVSANARGTGKQTVIAGEGRRRGSR